MSKLEITAPPLQPYWMHDAVTQGVGKRFLSDVEGMTTREHIRIMGPDGATLTLTYTPPPKWLERKLRHG